MQSCLQGAYLSLLTKEGTFGDYAPNWSTKPKESKYIVNEYINIFTPFTTSYLERN